MTSMGTVNQNQDAKLQPSSVSKTLQSVQFLRFFAATLVVVYHAYITFVPSALSNPLNGAAYWFGFGKVGVHIFFVISGYIMYLTSFARKRILRPHEFLLRRILRVYPTYWIFVMLYISYGLLVGTVPSLSVRQFIGMLMLIPPSSPLVIGPAWTLSYEVYFYLVFGAVMALGARRGTIALTSVFMISAGVGAALHPENAVAALTTNSLLLEFVMGVWIARLTTLHTVSHATGWLAIAIAIASFVGGLVWGYGRLPSAVIWGIPSTLLIAGAVVLEQHQYISRFSSVGRLSWLGDSSYSLYLFHILLITIVVRITNNINTDIPVLFLILLTAIGCIISATFFYKFIERPMTIILNKSVLRV